MKQLPEKKRLLADVLAEESEPEFREALLGQTLRLVKRRRRFRQVRRTAGAFALALGMVLIGWHFIPRSNVPVSKGVPSRGYTLVRTRSFAGIVSSRPATTMAILSSAPAATVVSTRDAHRHVPEISDTQLLDLVQPSVAVLVRYSPGNAELVFANPKEGEIFLRN